MASVKRWEMDGYIQNSTKPTAAVPPELAARLDSMSAVAANFQQIYPSLQKILAGDGWSPVLTLVEHGEKRVLRIADWTGGLGAKPANGGYIGPDGVVTDMDWAIDVRGPAGISGAAGGSGAKGERGPEGPQGPAGPAGAKGETGDPGPRGLTGADGPRGLTGEPGAAGAAGQRGEQGAKGLDGATGPAGPDGARGLQGNTGETGATGANGPVGPSALVKLGTVNVGETATIAITAGIRTITRTGIAGLLAGDNVILVPTAALPAGYAIHNAVATANGTLQITLNAPLLVIGASYSITCRVEVLR